MIYTASFFNDSDQHGQAFSIARTQPRGFALSTIRMFRPSAILLHAYRIGDLTFEQYAKVFRNDGLEPETPAIVTWAELQTGGETTLCCWEPTPTACHRRVVGEFLQELGYPATIN